MSVPLEIEFRPGQLPEFAASELLEELRTLGYDAGMAEAWEQRDRQVVTEILVWLGERVAENAVAVIVGAVAGWYGRKVKDRSQEPPIVRVLYRPDGSELKRIKLERPKD